MVTLSNNEINNRKWLYLFQPHQLLSTLLSVVLLFVALGVLWLGHQIKSEAPDTVMVREIAIAMPPPPPPPAMEQPVIETPVTVRVEGAGVEMQIINIESQSIEVSKPDTPKVSSTQPQWQSLEVNLDAFSLNDLDTKPSLLTPLRVRFPKSLTRRGVHSALVKLDILIDEQGAVSLLGVVENPYPELKSEIIKLVRSSRFSSPKKGQNSVRARFIWPIEMKP